MFGKAALPDRDQLTAAQQQAIDNRFSLVELRKIHAQLVENKSVTDENQGLVVEILRVLAEMVVYGDRKSELLFDYFCEKNMLQLFLEIMWSNPGNCPSNVHVQILQTLSILISSVRNDTSLYYLLSNNHINEVIIFPYDMDTDESLVAQYVSFIKTLALRLNDQTVQFFFITDTGAFPILTRSIDLLCQKDPMVRIAAQTAILNVYRVNEHRSRVFALQEDVMLQLFQAIVEIMKEQLELMHTICCNYARENDEGSLPKLEQNLNDAFINLEDWLYYIQDLIGLGIDKFNKAFIRYIVDVFVEGVVLTACLPYRTDSSEDGFLHDGTTIKEHKSVSSSDSKPVADTEHLLATVSLSYLLHMTRVINHSYFHESVMIAILHPLESGCRGTSLSMVADWADDQCPDISTLFLRANPYRNAYFALLVSENNRLSLLAAYIVCSLVSAYRDYYKSELIDKLTRQEGEDYFAAHDDNKDKAQRVIDAQIVTLFEVLHVIPPTVAINAVENSEMRQLERLDILVVRPYLQHIGVNMSEDLLVAQLVKVLKVAHTHPLVTIQTISFTLSSVLDAIMQYYLKHNQVSSNGSTSLPTPPSSPSSMPSLPPTPPICDVESAIAVLKEVREACRSAGQSLLARLSSSFSEVLLIIINEETKRFAGRVWKSAFPRMVVNKLLFLPAVSALTVRLGLDFDMPISPTEAMRKEVQVFLLLRALFKMHCQHVLRAANVEIDDELGNYVNDFLCLDDANIIPVHVCIVGAAYDMKGKKFLDAVLPIASTGTTTPTNQSPSSGYSLTASATSILTFGLVGGSGSSSRRSSFSSPSKGVKSPASNATSPVPTLNGAASTPTQVSKLKLLFVQEPNMLMLTVQDKSAGKSVFKVHILAPLLYSDAKVDLHERRRLKIIVRSWRPLSNMQRLDAEGSESSNGDGSESSRNSLKLAQKPMEGYLKAAEKSQLWHVTLVMDTEQACSLAAQHIESRRKHITAQKIDQLRSILSNWSLDAFDLNADNI